MRSSLLSGRLQPSSKRLARIASVVLSIAVLSASPANSQGETATKPLMVKHVLQLESTTTTVPSKKLANLQRAAAKAGSHLQLVSPSGEMTTVSKNLKSVNIPAGHLIKINTAADSRIEGGKLRMLAPVRYVIGSPDGTLIDFVPVVIVEQGALVMSELGNRFESEIAVGVEAASGPSGTTDLPPNTSIQLFAANATVEPDLHSLEHTNAPFPKSVVWSRTPPDTVQLTLAMSFDRERVVLDIPVVRPSVKITAREKLPGWGVGATRVAITLEGYAGSQSKQVLLSTSKGEFRESNIEVARDQSRLVWFRSSGTGLATITAECAGLKPTSQTITFGLPIGFFLTAIIGAVGGAWTKGVLSKNPKSKGSRIRLVASVIVGLLAALTWVLRMDLLPVRLPFEYNEITILLAAAIGAIASKFFLDRISGSNKSTDRG